MKNIYIIHYEGKDKQGRVIMDGNSETVVTNPGEGFLSEWLEKTTSYCKEKYPSIERLVIVGMWKL